MRNASFHSQNTIFHDPTRPHSLCTRFASPHSLPSTLSTRFANSPPPAEPLQHSFRKHNSHPQSPQHTFRKHPTPPQTLSTRFFTINRLRSPSAHVSQTPNASPDPQNTFRKHKSHTESPQHTFRTQKPRPFALGTRLSITLHTIFKKPPVYHPKTPKPQNLKTHKSCTPP